MKPPLPASAAITPRINPNIFNVKESATLAINLRVKEMRALGQDVVHFGFGESPFPVPTSIKQALEKNSGEKSYLPTQGLEALRISIAAFYAKHCQYEISPDRVCIGPGSKELIFQIIYLLEGPLIIPAPSWVSYGPQAAIRGKQVVTIETDRDNSYKLTTAELIRCCEQQGEGQKILILNDPNNPTGASYASHELAALAEVCRAHNVIVISDEIYGLVRFDAQTHTSLVHYYPEATIVTSGLSKAFSAGGYRLGILIMPEGMQNLLDALKAMISETFSAVSSPIQYAAISAFDFGPSVQAEVKRGTEIHQFAGRYLYRRFIDMGLNCPKPDGAFYLFPDFENFRSLLSAMGINTSKQLVAHLLETYKIAMLPASDFYLPDKHLGVRIASVDYDGKVVLMHFPGGKHMNKANTNQLFPNLVKGCDRLEVFLKHLKNHSKPDPSQAEMSESA